MEIDNGWAENIMLLEKFYDDHYLPRLISLALISFNNKKIIKDYNYINIFY